MTLTLAAIPTWTAAVGIVFFLAICVGLILIVLIQRPQGGGLGGAFGGGAAGSGQTAFGARTGDFLTWSTISLFVIFLTVAALLNFVVLPPTAQIAPSISPAGAPATTPTDTDTQPVAVPPAPSTPAPTDQSDSANPAPATTTPASTPPPAAPPENQNPDKGDSSGGNL